MLTNVNGGGGKNQKFKKYKRDAEKCCIYENKAVPLYFENKKDYNFDLICRENCREKFRIFVYCPPRGLVCRLHEDE